MSKKKHTYLKLFISTFYLSAFTFGGGFVIIPLMKRKFVGELKWIEEEEMKAGIHPTQVLERVEDNLKMRGVKFQKITKMDYKDNRVEVYLDDKLYGVFDFIENVFC